MRYRFKFPIRLKIMLSLLFVVTAVVSTITFAMAQLFHEDKKTYIQGLVSTAAQSAADETRSLVESYRARTLVYARILDDPNFDGENRNLLMRDLFTEFPQLIALYGLTDDGEIVFSAQNRTAFEVAEVDPTKITDALVLESPGWTPDEEQRAHLINFTIDPKLPMLALTVNVPGKAVDDNLRVTSLVSLAELDTVASRVQGLEVFIADRDGLLLAHSDSQRTAHREKVHLQEDEVTLATETSAGIAFEFDDGDTPMVGGYASVDFAGLMASTQIPRTAAYLASRNLLKQLMGVALALLVASTVVGLVWARRLTRNVERLSEAASVVAGGVFDVRVDVQSRDEIGDLAQTFNRMTGDLKERDEELNEAQSQLVQSEKLAAFGQLGAGIAHEVKNPLAGILGCTQLSLRKVEKEGPVFENLRLIEKETKRCKEIIENLLRFARQEKAVHEPVSINNVIEDGMAIINHQLELNKISVTRDLADNLPLIRGSGNQLQQVLMNLMINAQQAMEGSPGTILVRTYLGDHGKVVVSVKDSGPGIPMENQVKLFEPFFTTKPGGKGTGLGLSVSFGIIEDHGGTIRIESEVGHGATFVIELPAKAESVQSAAKAGKENSAVLVGVE